MRQVHQRDGALEISVPEGRAAGAEQGGIDLVWRVRVLGLSEQEILVEQPSAAGSWIELQPGVRLIAGMSIGQNRWMFHTRLLGPGAKHPRTLRLAMPETVERCQRRNFLRISTAELSLPLVECWSLLDPSSVVAAEVANQAQVHALAEQGADAATALKEPTLLPEAGPKFTARLMNIGGGGAGLIIAPGDSAAVDRARLYWVRLHLMPHVAAPLGITARLVHTHIDSTQSLYAGMAFEWSFNPGHRDFVIEQITRCVRSIQRSQSASGKAA